MRESIRFLLPLIVLTLGTSQILSAQHSGFMGNKTVIKFDLRINPNGYESAEGLLPNELLMVTPEFEILRCYNNKRAIGIEFNRQKAIYSEYLGWGLGSYTSHFTMTNLGIKHYYYTGTIAPFGIAGFISVGISHITTDSRYTYGSTNPYFGFGMTKHDILLNRVVLDFTIGSNIRFTRILTPDLFWSPSIDFFTEYATYSNLIYLKVGLGILTP